MNVNCEGFFRVAAASPRVSVGDCHANTDHILRIALEATAAGAEIIVFPEMSVTGYTCADLFHTSALLSASTEQLLRLARHAGLSPIVVGAPIAVGTSLYNCAVVIYRGRIVAVVPKTYVPNYGEFYECRWWQPAPDTEPFTITIGDHHPLFGTRQLIEVDGVKIGVEICEDLWVPIPPSSLAAMAGAEVVLSLSASDDLIGKYAYLQSLISQQSARCICAYAYAGAGFGESSTDLVFDGKTIIAENGTILRKNDRWHIGDQWVMTDIDILALRHDRMRSNTFAAYMARTGAPAYAVHQLAARPAASARPELLRHINPTPFVPPTDEDMARRCHEILNIQVAGLAKRLDAIHCRSLVVGISGGLDSTLALLVAVMAFDKLGFDRKGIIGITMPGFGTSHRTHTNAHSLMELLGVSMREIPISKAVEQHFSDIGHDPAVHDVTYENSQARERTQILMDVANQSGGIVLGTGDLSELALGWATYNGDHMSMYGVNAGVPKTLVGYLVKHFALTSESQELRHTLLDIVDTPISPELTPADSDGQIAQKTEDLVGPYELHDFFLYYTLRYGFSPERIFYMASIAFEGKYPDTIIDHWLRTFMRRFFQQQFKRSCLPDGPKVGSVCLSPRGDWRMPSDAVLCYKV